ncbi:MAG: ribosome maturation factor RimP [Eubacterium sp.]|nr:ribosome maturation factor RimP [Eubacterium sp.]
MKKSEIEKITTDLVLPIIESGGFDLWDVEYVKEGSDYYLRVYVDKEGGIQIDDCVAISRALEKEIDKLDSSDQAFEKKGFIEEAYILEVSSPGLTRRLKKDRDFEKSIGRLVLLKLYKAQDGQKEYTGYLKGFNEEEISIENNKEIINFNRDNISSIRLEFEE